MTHESRSRRGLSRLLQHSLFAGAGLLGSPDPASAPEIPDPDHRSTAPSIASLLADMNPFDATELVATAATDPDPNIRLAIAEALEAPLHVVGIEFALDHLRTDLDPRVREIALRSSERRRLLLWGALVIDPTRANRPRPG